MGNIITFISYAAVIGIYLFSLINLLSSLEGVVLAKLFLTLLSIIISYLLFEYSIKLESFYLAEYTNEAKAALCCCIALLLFILSMIVEVFIHNDNPLNHIFPIFFCVFLLYLLGKSMYFYRIPNFRHFMIAACCGVLIQKVTYLMNKK